MEFLMMVDISFSNGAIYAGINLITAISKHLKD